MKAETHQCGRVVASQMLMKKGAIAAAHTNNIFLLWQDLPSKCIMDASTALAQIG